VLSNEGQPVEMSGRTHLLIVASIVTLKENRTRSNGVSNSTVSGCETEDRFLRLCLCDVTKSGEVQRKLNVWYQKYERNTRLYIEVCRESFNILRHP
jgi:hypothetical protein